MMCLFCIARAVSEADGVVEILIKELSKVLCYSNKLKLIEMRWWVKDSFYQVYSISNNYDVIHINFLNCLINSTFNSEQFCLCWCDIDGMMNSFSKNIVAWMNMWY